MKARVKATGEIVEVKIIDQLKEEEMYVEKFGEMSGRVFHITELDFDNLDDPDYWTRLEHTYAGMAMQEILRGCGDYYELKKLAPQAHEYRAESIAEISKIYAHALVEKMKEEK